MPRARRIAQVAALLLILGGAQAAPAAGLPPGRSGLYGGGAVVDYLNFVSLRVLPDGTLSAHATLVTKCSPRFGDQLTEGISVRDARLDGDGLYRARTSFAGPTDPEAPLAGGLFAEGTIYFSARVMPGGLAHGTVRVRTDYSESEGGQPVSRCDTGAIPWVARRPGAGAGGGRTVLQPGTHRGTTGQDQPFLMHVTGRGRLVGRAGLTVSVDCPSAVGMPLDVVARHVRVRRGRFGAAGAFARPYTGADGRPVVERYRWELSGRFGRRGARGTFALKGVVRRTRDGTRVGACSTGPIAWRAAR